MTSEEVNRAILETNVEYHENRISRIEESIITLNHEMGEVQRSLGKIEGRVGMLVWLMGATGLVILAEFIRSLLVR